jgi:lipopolysaccharide export system protein LptC
MMDILRQILDRLTLYLPVVLMGVLAMATYWLVRSTPEQVTVAPAVPVEHEPNYFIRQFAVKTYDSTGRLKSEVKGVEARHFPDTDTLEIDQANILSFNQDDRLTTAKASRAITNGDASEVQLIGHAKVVREAIMEKGGVEQPALTFTGEFLHAFMNTERLKSHKPVELVRGNDWFTADSMDFDNLERVMVLTGRVKGKLTPTANH